MAASRACSREIFLVINSSQRRFKPFNSVEFIAAVEEDISRLFNFDRSVEIMSEASRIGVVVIVEAEEEDTAVEVWCDSEANKDKIKPHHDTEELTISRGLHLVEGTDQS